MTTPTPEPTPEPAPTPSAYTPPASQEDLDRIITARLARERERFADYSDLKAKAKAHDAALEAAKTDADKAIDAARKEGESQATERANSRLISAEARALAAELKFRNPTLAIRAIDLSGVSVGDDGNVDAAAIKAKLAELSTAEPYLVDDGKTRPQPDPSQGGGGSASAPSVQRGKELWDQRHPKKAS